MLIEYEQITYNFLDIIEQNHKLVWGYQWI